MNLRDFVAIFNISGLTEIEKVARIYYFLTQTTGINSFTISDVVQWFADSDLAAPNPTRLKKRLSASRNFIRGNQKDSFKLHAGYWGRLKEIYVDASFQQTELPKSNSRCFVSPSRIEELRVAKSNEFDLTKLLQICKELNAAYMLKSYLSIIMLTRALIDHVPPLFGARTFAQVASSYAGTKSFKVSMQHLEDSSRTIADQHLHGQIRKREVLPVFNQVDFSNDVDVLLAEIVRILKQ